LPLATKSAFIVARSITSYSPVFVSVSLTPNLLYSSSKSFFDHPDSYLSDATETLRFPFIQSLLVFPSTANPISSKFNEGAFMQICSNSSSVRCKCIRTGPSSIRYLNKIPTLRLPGDVPSRNCLTLQVFLFLEQTLYFSISLRRQYHQSNHHQIIVNKVKYITVLIVYSHICVIYGS
jgi:hypothetical protein